MIVVSFSHLLATAVFKTHKSFKIHEWVFTDVFNIIGQNVISSACVNHLVSGIQLKTH